MQTTFIQVVMGKFQYGSLLPHSKNFTVIPMQQGVSSEKDHRTLDIVKIMQTWQRLYCNCTISETNDTFYAHNNPNA